MMMRDTNVETAITVVMRLVIISHNLLYINTSY